ncbi:MAG TPA: aldehyde dehydrogenase family protein [Actinomycetota bacterium]|nr:aldehyde dehydrogenase family protein [Actinomycetota bacterium]
MAEEFLDIYAGGEWITGHSGEIFEVRNPANRDDLIAVFARGDAVDVDEAVGAAKAAYPSWSQTPAPQRADYVLRVGFLLEQRKEELAHLMAREMGKTLRECRADIQEGIDFAYFMVGEGRRMYGVTTQSELPDKFSMTVRHPIGVAGLITPWNFPIAIPCWKLFPALISGCTIVFKPAEDTPLLAYHLVKMFEEVGLPAGVLNFVPGLGEEAGQPLVEHKDVRCLSFTGSLEVGRKINEIGARMMKRVSLELGSKNILIVMPDADLDLAVEAGAWGAFATSGQRCTATSRMAVHGSVLDEFQERLLARVKTMKVGPGTDPNTELAAVINAKQKTRILEYIGIGQSEGAKLIAGGHELTGGEYDNGNFIAPTVFRDMTPNMRIAQEEIFGPVTGLIEVGGLEEAIEIANGTQYGLSCAIYTRDITNTFRAIEQLEFGVVYVNAPTIGAEVQLPFGGMKSTGNGHREAGPTALDEFTEWKAISVDYSGKIQKAQMQGE